MVVVVAVTRLPGRADPGLDLRTHAGGIAANRRGRSHEIGKRADRAQARLRHHRRAAGRDRDYGVAALSTGQHPPVAEGSRKEHRDSAVCRSEPAKDQEYFSDGITEQIIDSLAHVHGLFVVARTTAFSFKNKNMDIRDIGRQLAASHVLEGSVVMGRESARRRPADRCGERISPLVGNLRFD